MERTLDTQKWKSTMLSTWAVYLTGISTGLYLAYDHPSAVNFFSVAQDLILGLCVALYLYGIVKIYIDNKNINLQISLIITGFNFLLATFFEYLFISTAQIQIMAFAISSSIIVGIFGLLTEINLRNRKPA